MYTITSIVPFDMIIDIDMGLLKLIQKEYANQKVFRKSILSERNMDIMKIILIDRPEINPLKFFVNPEYIKDADGMYQQFIEERYHDIIDLSCTTGIFDIIRRSKSVNDIVKYTIVCRSDYEKIVLESKYKKYNIQPNIKLISDYHNLNIDSYGSIYIKNYQDILNYSNIFGKNILIGNYRFNMENGDTELGIPLKEVTEQLIAENSIKIIDIYPLAQSKISVG